MNPAFAPSAGSAGAKWALLRAGGHVGDGLEIPTMATDVSAVAGPVRLAVGPQGEPRLLVPLEPREASVSVETGDALAVVETLLSHKGARLRFLDVMCVREELETVFGEVVDEVLARIGQGGSGADAVQSTIKDFRALLIRAPQAGVSLAAVVGLVAELLVLDRLLTLSPRAWRAWRGPLGDRHDFRVGDTSLEIKASLRSDASGMIIHGLGQLEVPTGGSLHILRLILEPVADGILSMAELAESAIAKADDPSQVEALLAASGCRDPYAQEWNRHSFRHDSECLYEVGAGFPRLTRSMLKDGVVPQGVDSVKYAIDVSVAEEFRCSGTEYRDLETRLIP